ncbi:hypothetical protein Gogos_000878 [Gossypium gossypioides]|uniref:Biotin carboxyl carrier protein of acetyl-CoA carboxylase n=1 Tax=Gossypium gossypioides TaxID=34282 RepID=A0A7J9CU29_GOSGO|nr:hypothetical protein [Gossypium gossypioides]
MILARGSVFKFSSLPGHALGSSVAFKVAVDGSSNDSTIPPVNSGSSTPEPQFDQVDLFYLFSSRLVDSRDIVELQLKQLDCELIIRKNAALPQPPSAAPVGMSQASSLPPVGPPTQTAPASAPTPSGQAPAVVTPPSFPSAKSLLPPLKCPMAGTFYTSPGPGEPPFVKVGDKVQKGQVLCIIEAMKLMNEIEADQSGTIVEILVEDGKAVSVDTVSILCYLDSK